MCKSGASFVARCCTFSSSLLLTFQGWPPHSDAIFKMRPQPLAAKSKLYLLAVGLFALTEIGAKGGYLAPKPVALGEGILRFKNHSACGVNHSWYPCIHESTDSRVWDR